MDYEELNEEELANLLIKTSWWIQAHYSCSVYFKSCLLCGENFGSNRDARLLCNGCYSHRTQFNLTRRLHYKNEPGHAAQKCKLSRIKYKEDREAGKIKHRIVSLSEHLSKPHSDSELGIAGVHHLVKNRRGKTQGELHYYIARITPPNGGRVFLKQSSSLFEACCARKSAEARILKGLPPK